MLLSSPVPTWCALCYLRNHLRLLSRNPLNSQKAVFGSNQCHPFHTTSYRIAKNGQPKFSSKEIRSTFVDYFRDKHDHQYVHSSSVIPRKGQGTYFVNAGMNQFKPIFLGTVDAASEMASYRRAVNSQKCIRVGGKHNDLDDVGKDLYHHTFFEMLGTWSFADYFKVEACSMAWELLTKVYGLPPERLYVTYFGGNPQLGLEPDHECRDIWRALGVSAERILPFGMKDNFWDMGETGPCGPCTEIHYDHIGDRNAAGLVNMDSPEVIELWNLVFMQYDRQVNGSLRMLPQQHVDTGMGLERLTAVLQGTTSNYNTDLFQPLFNRMYKEGKVASYQGLTDSSNSAGVDTAYRIVADHLRMATVAIADGLLPGREDLEHKLRHIIHRAIKHAHGILRMPQGTLGNLVPVVVESLGEAFPEVARDAPRISQVLDMAEDRYLSMLKQGERSMATFLKRCPQDIRVLTGDDICELIEGRYGGSLPLDILADLAEDRGLQLDMEAYEVKKEEMREKSAAAVESQRQRRRTGLDTHHIDSLKERGVPSTDDSPKYNYTFQDGCYNLPPVESEVLALFSAGEEKGSVGRGSECHIVVRRTCFFAECGGQAADKGTLLTTQGCEVEITDVQSHGGYVVHCGIVTKGSLTSGDTVELSIDQEHRGKCMRNHTATHILNFALNQVVGEARQSGSSVTADKLTFDFTSLGTIGKEDISRVESLANAVIERDLQVYRKEENLSKVKQVKGLVTLLDEVYPNTVQVVSIGADAVSLTNTGQCDHNALQSAELCGGTHVLSTGHIGQLVITKMVGMGQGTKRATVVTHSAAHEARSMAGDIRREIGQLASAIESKADEKTWLKKVKVIDTLLSENVLPKLEREELQDRLDRMKEKVNAVKNKAQKLKLIQRLEDLLEEAADGDGDKDVVVKRFRFDNLKDVIKGLSSLQPALPVMLLCEERGKTKAVCYVPQNLMDRGFTPQAWMSHIAPHVGGTALPPKGKNVNNFYILMSNSWGHLDTVIAEALEYRMR